MSGRRAAPLRPPSRAARKLSIEESWPVMHTMIRAVATTGASAFFSKGSKHGRKGAVKRGALARKAGCNIETIRYYEQIGLLRFPDRTQSGHRLYSADDEARLCFILRGRELGFSIEELRDLLKLDDSESYTCGEVLGITRNHIASVNRKIADLKKLERTLSSIAAQCDGSDLPECPVINALWSTA